MDIRIGDNDCNILVNFALKIKTEFVSRSGLLSGNSSLPTVPEIRKELSFPFFVVCDFWPYQHPESS